MMTHLAISKPLELEIKAFCARSNLTPRESEILAILAEGVVRIKDVADRLRLSPNTVNNHVNSIFMKTRTRSKSQLLAGLLNHVATELQSARYFRQSPRALVIDKDTSMSYAMGQILEKRGFVVLTVANQEEGLLRLAEFGPHFVLADLATLNQSGGSFVKSVGDKCCAQVLLMGSGAGITDRWQAMNEGAIDLLGKPLDPVLLLQVLMCHFIENDEDRARYVEAETQPTKMSQDEFQLTCENLGAGGIYLTGADLQRILGAPVSIGDQIELRLRFDRVAEPIPARGQVVWARGAGDVGIRFMQLPRLGRERLARFLRENSIRSYIPAGGAASVPN